MTLHRVAILGLLIPALCQDIRPSALYERCTLIADIRNTKDLVGYKDYTIGDYVCLAHYISGYDTSLHVSDTEYGIYQVNHRYWCDDGHLVGRMNLCGVLCTDLLNKDIKDDLRCVGRIIRDPKGLAAWPVWEEQCKGKDLSRFTDGC